MKGAKPGGEYSGQSLAQGGRIGWVGGFQSPGIGMTRGLPELLLEHEICLFVVLKQVLQVVVDVIILLQVV